jgi:hypothetical protein
VDASTVSNPILWEKGIRRMLGVLPEAGPTLLGVLHVGRVGDRGFTEGDASRLEVGEPAAGCRSRQTHRRCGVDLPLGSVLVAYSDGLVERRGEVVDEGTATASRRCHR